MRPMDLGSISYFLSGMVSGVSLGRRFAAWRIGNDDDNDALAVDIRDCVLEDELYNLRTLRESGRNPQCCCCQGSPKQEVRTLLFIVLLSYILRASPERMGAADAISTQLAGSVFESFSS